MRYFTRCSHNGKLDGSSLFLLPRASGSVLFLLFSLRPPRPLFLAAAACCFCCVLVWNFIMPLPLNSPLSSTFGSCVSAHDGGEECALNLWEWLLAFLACKFFELAKTCRLPCWFEFAPVRLRNSKGFPPSISLSLVFPYIHNFLNIHRVDTYLCICVCFFSISFSSLLFQMELQSFSCSGLHVL